MTDEERKARLQLLRQNKTNAIVQFNDMTRELRLRYFSREVIPLEQEIIDLQETCSHDFSSSYMTDSCHICGYIDPF